MKNRHDKIKRYYDAVGHVLLEEWDPIGVSDVPEAQDEYDSYVSGVAGLLIRGASSEEIFRHLWEIETVSMRLQGNRNHTQSIAEKLAKIPSQIGDRP